MVFVPVEAKILQFKPNSVSKGTLNISKHHLILAQQSSSNTEPQTHKWLHSLIVSVDRKQEAPNVLIITYRTFCLIKLVLVCERDALAVRAELERLINTPNIQNFYCFAAQNSSKSDLSTASDERLLSEERKRMSVFPWSVYQPMVDFTRMGVDFTREDSHWRLSDINRDYKFSPTYPNLIGVPQKISDNTLKHIGKFRSKARIPALSYVHKKNGAAITRCSQPMIGIQNKTNIQDEKLIELIFQSNAAYLSALTNPSKTAQHLIIDARPLTNAMAQKAMGAGVEGDNYKGCKVVYLGIENIHVVRESYQRLFEACISSDGQQFSKGALDRSGWLKHIKSILDGALTISKNIDEGACSVVIHCSDGWDRTAQLSSLTQIYLDPYYRTIAGLMVLLEKEWISFGHKFRDRCGHIGKSKATGDGDSASSEKKWQQASKNMFGAATSFFSNLAQPNGIPPLAPTEALLTPTLLSPQESSPIFAQFLDCLYQVWRQYPQEFEYDERLLETLYWAVWSCEWGNFLFNCQREMREYTGGARSVGVEECTGSVWQHVQSAKESYINPIYTPSGGELASAGPIPTTPGAVDAALDAQSPTSNPGIDNISLDEPIGRVLAPTSANLTYWSRVYKISPHNFNEEDALLASSASSLKNGGGSNRLSVASSMASPSLVVPELLDPLLATARSQSSASSSEGIEALPSRIERLSVHALAPHQLPKVTVRSRFGNSEEDVVLGMEAVVDLQQTGSRMVEVQPTGSIHEVVVGGGEVADQSRKSVEGVVLNPLMVNPWS